MGMFSGQDFGRRTDGPQRTERAPMVDQSGTRPEEASGEHSDIDLYKAFVGPNAERFGELFGEQKNFSFNWVVFLTGLPWFLYRKLYLVGIAILIVPIVLVVVFPDLSTYASMGFSGALAVTANSIYVAHARKKIEKLKAADLPQDVLLVHAQQAGGTSPVGAAFGVLIVLSLIAIAVVTPAMAELPTCDSPQVHSTAQNLLEESLAKQGIATEGLAVSNFAALSAAATEGDKHLCSFQASVGADSRKLFLSVSWKDRKAGEYQINLASRLDALPN